MSNSKQKKSLWVTSITPKIVNGKTYVPTTLSYTTGAQPEIGLGISEEVEGRVINRNFKVDLGSAKPGNENREQFECQDGESRSAYRLAKDYFDGILSDVDNSLQRDPENLHLVPAKILVAEPLSFQVADNGSNWLQYYRNNIGRILSNYTEVQFLPEPFAVYQYYRYGQRLPQLSQDTKQIALIIDFGGGTFDSCVIESTNSGDVSQKGKHSKPLSAQSIPFGGYGVDNLIAEYLIKRDLQDKGKKKAAQYTKLVKRIDSGELDALTLNHEKQVFVKNFRLLTKACERYKIDLSEKIINWSLTGHAYESVAVKLPKDPFSQSEWIDAEFFAHQLRSIFINEIWNSHLKASIGSMLNTAKEGLRGKTITITLVSGGSANLKWLMKLLIRDFEEEIGDAKPIPISHSFQEIVANGLAIECARRFYDESSEFVGVTYNPIRLALNSDDRELQSSASFRSVSDRIDMQHAKGGDLLPSAQSMEHFYGDTLSWKVKLKHPPKRFLDYYFTKADSDGVDSCYNVESTRLQTPAGAKFDSKLIVELTIERDGTTKPEFVYKSANENEGRPRFAVTGRKFFIDATTGPKATDRGSLYIGLDFGTSNSSLCVLDGSQLELVSRRESSSNWVSLSDSLTQLPYSIAYPVRKYLNVDNFDNRANVAREAFESCLCLLSYLAVCDAGQSTNVESLLKAFQHRSLGPLIALLDGALKKVRPDSVFTNKLKKSFVKNEQSIRAAIKDFNDHKHQKRDANFDHTGHLELIVSTCCSALNGLNFGYCATCDEVGFDEGEYSGSFRVAEDIPPFKDSIQFHTDHAVNSAFPLLVSPDTSTALNLFPFFFLMPDSNSAGGRRLFCFDKADQSSISVKPIDADTVCKAKDIDPKLHEEIRKLLSGGKVRKNLTIDIKTQEEE